MSTSKEINLTSLSQVRALLGEHGIRPSRALGQNFLIDLNILDILIETADVSPGDRVLEVGPGLGVVTERLLEKAQHLVAVEKDDKLFRLLEARFAGYPQLELICSDMLDLGTGILATAQLTKLVSNLPYSAGSRILVELAMSDARPRQMTVTVQEEVAERLAAKPGNKDYGTLTIWLQADYNISLVKTISPSCFWPRPEVRSVIVNMVRHDRNKLDSDVRRRFYKLTKHAFTYRRKQLSTIFTHTLGSSDNSARVIEVLEALNIDLGARPEQVPVEDWCRLATRMSQ